MNTVERIIGLINSHNINAHKLQNACELSNSAISDWKSGKAKPSADALKKIADYFNVSVDYLLGRVENPQDTFHPSNEIYVDGFIKMRVIGHISAGYDGQVVEEELDDFPVLKAALRGYDVEDCFLLKVKGNSMYPDYKDKDYILVHRQSSVDSGDVAVVLYTGDEATIKKVNYKYGEDWMELEPRNPEFQAKRIEGADLEECRILGKVLGIVWREV